MERRRPIADGVGRFLSVLAILIAGISSLYLYQQNQQLKTTLESITAGSGEDGTGTNIYEKHANEWDAKLTNALNLFAVDTKASLEEFDEARTARNDIMKESIRLSEAEVQQIVQNQLRERTVVGKPVLDPPHLLIKETVLKTADGEDAPMVIANDGDVLAEIVSVTFQPTPDSQFETSLPSDHDEDAVVVRFTPEHNKPTKAGYHKVYTRSYQRLEQTVGANDSALISIEIGNDRHVDFEKNFTWGMRGELRLVYDDGQMLVIPSIPAVFVPEKLDI